MNSRNYEKMKNKTTNVIVSFCLFVHCLSNITPEEHYCRTIFITFMDSLIQQLNERFSGKTKSTMSGIYLILMKKLPESEILEYYQSDLPSDSSVRQQIQL